MYLLNKPSFQNGKHHSHFSLPLSLANAIGVAQMDRNIKVCTECTVLNSELNSLTWLFSEIFRDDA